MLLVVLAAKVAATSATVGSGAVGGVFTPTLFIGCAVGALYGGTLHHLMPSFTSQSTAPVLPVTLGQWRNTLIGEVSRHDVLLAVQDRLTCPK